MPKKTSGKSAARRRKQPGKIQDLPAKAKRAANVKGGIITGAGAGGGPHVQVFDGKTGS